MNVLKVVRTWVIPVLAYFFLFTGLIKGEIQSQFDLTILFTIFTAIFLISENRRNTQRWDVPLVPILIAIILMFFIRLFPNFTNFGVEKTAKLIFLGLPAFYFGNLILGNTKLYSNDDNKIFNIGQ